MKNEIKQRKIQEKKIRKDISKLKRERKYQEIFDRYGQQRYIKEVPKKYKARHIKELFEEGRYEDIYRLYGSKEYDNLVYKMMEKEVYLETGEKKKVLQTALKPINLYDRAKNIITRRVIAYILALTFSVAPAATVNQMVKSMQNESAQKYGEQIKKYNERLEDYVDKVKNMNLDNFETIMKVVEDMWQNIEGYGMPEINAFGYGRLDMTEGGVGVCRNMADDVTAKLNAINPEYNARNIVVCLEYDELKKHGIEMADIETKILTTEGNIVQEDGNVSTSNKGKYFGDHMVTAVDMPGKNITLIIDSTNPQIGVFKNGKIHMFFNEAGEGIRITPLGQFLITGTDETFDLLETQLLSFLPTQYTIEELEEMFGTEAQNKALQRIREKSGKTFAAKYAVKTDYKPTDKHIDRMIETIDEERDI